MYKIAICGKANSGKNTLSKMLSRHMPTYRNVAKFAFADPIKEMIHIMFPNIPRNKLYGSSKFRSEAIPGAFKDGQPLTIRQLLLDLGTGVGRSYQESIWLNNFDNRLEKAYKNPNNKMVIVTDVRFRNEFDHLKNKEFFMIKLYRNSDGPIINHVSETNQDSILDSEFDYVLDNNGSLKDLKNKVNEILSKVKP